MGKSNLFNNFSAQTQQKTRSYQAFGMWRAQNVPQWKSLQNHRQNSIFSNFSTRVFHSIKKQVLKQRKKAKQKRHLHKKRAITAPLEHTFKQLLPSGVCANLGRFCGIVAHLARFPQFPPPLLILLLYIISFFRYKALRANVCLAARECPKKGF